MGELSEYPVNLQEYITQEVYTTATVAFAPHA